MAENSHIEWTHHSFNLAWGCQKVSPGCAHCYADTLAHRFGHDVWGPPSTTRRRTMSDAYWRKPHDWDRMAAQAGEQRRVFCASMADVFEDHPDLVAERLKLWALIEDTPHLDWLLLTKRPENILDMAPYDWVRVCGPDNVWLGTSVENQQYADSRIMELLMAFDVLMPPVRFLSCEPLLGPVDLTSYLDPDYGINWVIVGGESGPGARPMQIEWVEDIVEQAQAAGVPVFVKQLGGHPHKRGGDEAVVLGKLWHQFPKVGG